ncbi:MAG: ATP-dependent DNA ligase [Methanobacteriaceae archaeon]|jgi:DNA ligase-1|nr:ATP-dependent DNA ligase [Methanobacteriaceae archaeon]MDO9627220.1 ATP-dependent DNA ligase [Methanobacteriaceae archaeon]
MIEPMLAQLKSNVFNLDGSWLIEPKYDGERLIAQREGNSITLWTRRDIQVSYKFPEIVSALKKNIKGENWILDGELTVSDGFRQLLKRNVEDKFKISILSRKIPATYNIFDIINWDGEFVMERPLIERKSLLLKAVNLDEFIDLIDFQELNDINKQLNDNLKAGFEGIVLKKTYSPYEPGKRSGKWIKIKKQDTIDVYVVGATKSTGSIAFGALILKKDGKFFGKVGTGFTDQDRKYILNILRKNEAPLDINLPKSVLSELLISNNPLLAEIRVQEIINNSPRAPVWVRFRWDD